MPTTKTARRSPLALISLTLATAAVALPGGAIQAPMASAHSLTTGEANAAAISHGKQINRRSSAIVKSELIGNCKRLYPHIQRCRVGYDTTQSLPTNTYDCVDTIEVYFKAHSKGISYTPFVQYAPNAHPC